MGSESGLLRAGVRGALGKMRASLLEVCFCVFTLWGGKLFVYFLISLCIYLSIYLFVYLFNYLFDCLFDCLSNCLFIQ